MGKTFSEKILGLKLGKEVVAGEIVNVEPDKILSHDNTAAISKTFAKIGVKNVKYPDRLVIIIDHCVPAADDKHAQNHKTIREFVEAQGIKHFYDINYGICHQVLPETGHAYPGLVIIGSDSHTTTYGAFGAFSAGIGRTEAAASWATGDLWFRVPETLRINITGQFPKRVSAKDLILTIIGKLGADGGLYRAVEFTGPSISELSMSDRMLLCNMSAEMGAKNGYIPPDELTKNWLVAHGVKEWNPIYSDPDANYNETLDFNLSDLVPCVAKPHTVDNYAPISEVKGTRVHQCLLGTCTNGRLDDLQAAAVMLKGKKISAKTRLLVFPASMRIFREAIADGTIDTLIAAGAVILNPGCGPCLGAHEGILAPEETCISTANRNFKGRMGNKDSYVYLASPEMVAASALTGEITDPREV